jgi:signal transduction histidine kinase
MPHFNWYSDMALPKIFDRSYRVDEARSQDEGSGGLRLSIAQRVVEAHLSTISVDSTPREENTFTISISLQDRVSGDAAPYLPDAIV